jgi:hypothetical protein
MTKGASKALFADWISVVECPDMKGLLFLGAAETRITLYSQQIRALRTIHALKELPRLDSHSRIAIVGAGAAGTTAAIALALLGHRVELIEQAAGILHLQSKSQRMLHPHIYDWPRTGSLQTHAALPIMEWIEAAGGDVRKALDSFFSSVDANHKNLAFRPNSTVTNLTRATNKWEISIGAEAPEEFDFVVLALGFGDERVIGDAPLHDYWKSSDSFGAALDKGSKQYFISGNGDGGLADAIAVHFEEFEQITFVKWFLSLFNGPELATEVAAIFSKVPNDGDLEPAFTETLLPIFLSRGVIKDLKQRLRKDRTVTLNCSKVLLQKGRAAPLNQVIMFAVLKACEDAGQAVTRTLGEITNVTKVASNYIVEGPAFGTSTTHFSDVILRHGPDRAGRYEFCSSFYVQYTSYIADLRISSPEKFTPPELDPASFAFFTKAYRASVSDATQATALDAITARQENTIIVNWDDAIQRATQQGAQTIQEICLSCCGTEVPVIIHLALQRSQISELGTELERFARASAGRILLEASPAVFLSWSGNGVPVSTQPTFVSPYRFKELPTVADLRKLFDSLLIQRLDVAVALCAAGNCGIFKDVHPSLYATFAETWSNWKAILETDNELRGKFLRVLAKAIDDGTGWDGAEDGFADLVAGSFLIMAAHAGRSATPTNSRHGNVIFQGDAIGVASGCKILDGTLISDVVADEFWSADALILAGAFEEMRTSRDLITDGGVLSRTLLTSERVRPAIVQNTRRWRDALKGDLTAWIANIEAEFRDWKSRQDAQLEK